MPNRFAVLVTTLIVIAVAAGCSQDTAQGRATTATITVDGQTETTREVSCTQVDWSLSIKTTSGSTRTDTFLQKDGGQATVKTVNISNFDGFNGVAGEGVGKAEASFANSEFVISGTAEGSSPDRPGQTRSVPFRIETSC
jgi:hypothetical protein